MENIGQFAPVSFNVFSALFLYDSPSNETRKKRKEICRGT